MRTRGRARAAILVALGVVFGALACTTPGPAAGGPPGGPGGGEVGAAVTSSGAESLWRARFPGADTVRVVALEPGVSHAYLWLREGPWAIHVLEVDEAVCGPRVSSIEAGPPLSDRARTSELAAGAIAGINADFFLIPTGTPAGGSVHRGRVLAGPSTRPLYGLDAAGRHVADVGRLVGWIAAPGDTAVIASVNRTGEVAHHRARPGVIYLDEWYGRPVPDTGTTVRVRRIPGAAGRGVVVAGAGQVALRARASAASAWLDRRAPGDTIGWELAVTAELDGSPVRLEEAVGGFPLLVKDGVGVYGAQTGVPESFGPARHPRTAVGWDRPGGRFVWVVVDGRRAPYSDGMTLPELEGLFLRLGVTDAINLDGGGSTAMVVEGRVVNRPSDAAGERPVGNALVLDRCAGPGGG